MLRARLLRVYFAMDDIALAAAAGDKQAAVVAWTRGKEYLDGYVRLINMPISSKVGDKFAVVDVGL